MEMKFSAAFSSMAVDDGKYLFDFQALKKKVKVGQRRKPVGRKIRGEYFGHLSEIHDMKAA